MDVKDLIRSALQGEASDFKDTFSSIMAGKLEDAIDSKYSSMFGSVDMESDFGDQYEEAEDIEETVNPPKSEDEKRFMDKHVADKKDHPEAEESQFTSKAKKAKRSADYEEGEDEEVYEETELEEATFKPGIMKLKDGSSVKVSREDVKALSTMFDELSGSNKKKMEEKMMEDEEGFEEILQFAKEAM